MNNIRGFSTSHLFVFHIAHILTVLFHIIVSTGQISLQKLLDISLENIPAYCKSNKQKHTQHVSDRTSAVHGNLNWSGYL